MPQRFNMQASTVVPNTFDPWSMTSQIDWSLMETVEGVNRTDADADEDPANEDAYRDLAEMGQ